MEGRWRWKWWRRVMGLEEEDGGGGDAKDRRNEEKENK